MKAIQIEDTHLNDSTREQIRSHVGTGSHCQSTVASTCHRNLAQLGVLMGNEPFGARAQIQKRIGLLGFVSIFMPAFTVFRASADIGHDKHAIEMVNPKKGSDGKERFHRNRETSVGVEMRRILTVFLQVFPMNQEHGHLRWIRRIQAIRRHEHLLGRQRIQVDAFEFDAFEYFERTVQ